MTPIELGFFAFCVTVGILLPVILVYSLRIISDICKEFVAFRHNRYRRFMNPDYWFLRDIKQAPNRDYIQLSYENSVSKEVITLGVEKRKLRNIL